MVLIFYKPPTKNTFFLCALSNHHLIVLIYFTAPNLNLIVSEIPPSKALIHFLDFLLFQKLPRYYRKFQFSERKITH